MYKQIANLIVEETQRDVVKAAHELLDDSKRFVPVKTGELLRSGKVITEHNSVTVTYDAEHALSVHENPNSRGYKYLERVAIENKHKYSRIIGGK